MERKRFFVTGGAGFLGSHLVDRLIEQGQQVTVYDNLTTGRESNMGQHAGCSSFSLVRGDLNDFAALCAAIRGHDIVFHWAANADIRGCLENTRVDVEQNILPTHNVLEAMRIHGIGEIAFASSSAVYGDPTVVPTPEDYPTRQTSLYGAAKLSSEALIEAYCEGFGMRGWCFRFASCLGPRYWHGVVIDFMRKLRNNPQKLEILGDGGQRKSFLHVRDFVDGVFSALEHAPDKVNRFNVGHTGYIDIVTVADLVCREMGLRDVSYRFTGGNRGWVGDCPFVWLDVSRLRNLGWNPQVSIPEAICDTVGYLRAHEELLATPHQE